ARIGPLLTLTGRGAEGVRVMQEALDLLEKEAAEEALAELHAALGEMLLRGANDRTAEGPHRTGYRLGDRARVAVGVVEGPVREGLASHATTPDRGRDCPLRRISEVRSGDGPAAHGSRSARQPRRGAGTERS